MKPDQQPYHLVDARLLRKKRLSPHMSRLTFGGPGIDRVKTQAPDQRIKVFFPTSSGFQSTLPCDDTWRAVYQRLPVGDRPQRRSYTIRVLRKGELDIDFVLHGEAGPASAWALRSATGDPVQIAAPNKSYKADTGGYEWRPSDDVKKVLLIGDETALPALAGILETIAEQHFRPEVEAFVEVPTSEDILDVQLFSELSLNWMPRDGGREPGASMVAAAQDAYAASGPCDADDDPLPEINVDTEVLWDQASDNSGSFYAWVAGEARSVKSIRKIFFEEPKFDKRCANLMGYWRLGRSLD